MDIYRELNIDELKQALNMRDSQLEACQKQVDTSRKEVEELKDSLSALSEELAHKKNVCMERNIAQLGNTALKAELKHKDEALAKIIDKVTLAKIGINLTTEVKLLNDTIKLAKQALNEVNYND